MFASIALVDSEQTIGLRKSLTVEFIKDVLHLAVSFLRYFNYFSIILCCCAHWFSTNHMVGSIVS